MMQPDLEAPPPSDEEAKEVSRTRANGWVCPWHPLQILGWFFLAFFSIAHFGFLVFYVPGYWRIPTYILPALIILTHIICNVVTTSLNPADPEVRRKGQHSRRRFNPSEHRHVIEDRYCNLCEVYVSESAKHCRVCDKCVTDFDHHCKWLNTCIGRRNYRWFFSTILSALLGAILLLLFSFSLFVVYFVNRDLLRYDCPHTSNVSRCDSDFRVFGAVMPHQVFPTLCAVIAFLSAVASLLDGHLCALHIYLYSKGLTTYEYILLQREKDEARQNASPREPFYRRLFLRWSKKNRVTPSTIDLNQDRPSSVHSLTPSSDGRSSSMSNKSRGSVGMDNFGRTPTVSVYSASPNGSPPHGNSSWAVADSQLNNQASHSVIEMNALVNCDPIVVCSPKKPQKMTKAAHTTSDPSLPKHLIPSPPQKLGLTVFKAASAGDLYSGSTLSFLVGDHDEVDCPDCDDSSVLSAMVVSNSEGLEKTKSVPKHIASDTSPVSSVKDITDRTSGDFNKPSSFIVLDMPRNLSSRPLPPIGAGPSDCIDERNRSQSLRLSPPTNLPALRTRSVFSLPDRALPKLTTTPHGLVSSVNRANDQSTEIINGCTFHLPPNFSLSSSSNAEEESTFV